MLAGRRGDRKPSLRSPILGVVLLGAGVAGAAYGARGAGGYGEYFIAGSAIVSVLGMILLVPVVLVVVSRLSARLPLTLRYAARDAARHRSRTVPAVAAVAATVAGVVALGIATTSDEKQNEAGYTPSLTAGTGVVQGLARRPRRGPGAILAREIPDATLTEVRGLAVPAGGFDGVSVTLPDGSGLLDSYGSSLGSDVLVSDGSTAAGTARGPGVRSAARSRRCWPPAGWWRSPTWACRADRVRISARIYDQDGQARGPGRPGATLPALVVPQAAAQARSAGRAVRRAAATRLGLRPAVVGLAVSGTDITGQQEQDVVEALAAASDNASFYVERGYQPDDATRILQWVLFGLGRRPDAGRHAHRDLPGPLRRAARPGHALGGRCRAPDPPGRRRGVRRRGRAWSGAVLGAGVGFIPGVAVTYPLTGTSWIAAGDRRPVALPRRALADGPRPGGRCCRC